MKQNQPLEKNSHKIGIRELTLITFFIICAGPYGIEETVQATGPFFALLFTALLPVILSFPISLICSEMGSIFPYRGSTVMWSQSIVDRIKDQLNNKSSQFSRKQLLISLTIFQIMNHLYANTLLLKAVVVNGILPSLICGYLKTLTAEASELYFKYIVSIVVFIILIITNMYGIDVVGWTQYFFLFTVMTPMLLLCIFSAPYWKTWKVSMENKPFEMDFGLLFSNLVWQCTGFDQATNMSGEVIRPEITYPISLSIVIALVIVCFFLPIISGVMVDPNPQNWVNGAFSQISLQLKGCQNGWLQYWFILAGGISSMSVLNGYITCSSRELYRNAKTGALPFGRWIAVLTDFRKKMSRKQRQNTETVIIQQHVQDDNKEASKVAQEFTMHELTYNARDSSADYDGAEKQIDSKQQQQDQQSDTAVPFIGMLIISIFPTILQFLSFESFMELGSFLIGTSMSFQIFFYLYARYGKYGYYSFNKVVIRQFYLGGKWIGSLLVCVTPVITILILWISQGWLPFLIYICVQVLLIGLWLVEIAIKKNKKKVQKREAIFNDGTSLTKLEQVYPATANE